MNTISHEELDAYKRCGPDAPHLIRVGMDTGGIAAGAGDIYDLLVEEKSKRGLAVEIRRTGSVGLVFADPVVVVSAEGMPDIMYGNVSAECARGILTEHVGKKQLLNDHVMATRQRSIELGESPVNAILIKDTSVEKGDKTEFFQASFEQELEVHGYETKCPVYRALDMGLYGQGLCVQLLPSGVTYANVLSPDIRRIITESMQNGRVVEDLLVDEPDAQVRIVLRNCGIVDPESLEDALRHGAYQGFKKVLAEQTPEQTIEDLKISGLRGRGGAGFPTWRKWHLSRISEGDQKYVICNADEGDPGAFMDRSVLEGDPHSVLEGLILSAYCTGSNQGYFYIRAEYPLAVKRVRQAIEQARERGLLGKNILGSGFDFDVKVRLGAGAFVCGEETSLIASIEGKRGSPQPRPPFPSQSGLWGKPTTINNVETLAAVPVIMASGGSWYAQYGTGESRGTKVFAVTGKVKNSQLVEVPMGITIRKIIYDLCGGVLDDVSLKAVQTGGPSGGVIPDKLLDSAISYESLQELGSIMGSGGMLVMDEHDSMVDVARFYLKFCVDESCGKCAPCRVGGFQLLQLLEKIFRGKGDEEDIEKIHTICNTMRQASLCGLGQTAPNPVQSTIKYFKDEYMAFIEGGASYARKIKKQLAETGQKAS